jgi:hypothetical protein
MAAAMAALREAGKLPEESVRLIFEGLLDGSLLGRADSMDTEFRMALTTIAWTSV